MGSKEMEVIGFDQIQDAYIIHSDLEFLMSICFIYDISDEKFKLYVSMRQRFLGTNSFFVNAFSFVVGGCRVRTLICREE